MELSDTIIIWGKRPMTSANILKTGQLKTGAVIAYLAEYLCMFSE